MSKEIIINVEKEQTRIAIVENGTLSELYFENPENSRTLGDIYLGRVRKVRPSIKAAFVDIGQKQDAFLHYSDLTENLEAFLAFVNEDAPQVARFWKSSKGKNRGTSPADRRGRGPGNRRRRGSPDVLKRGQRVLVRIVKEPISTKGSRVSTDISLAGRFLVLVPLADCTAVSKKIQSAKERRRLRELVRMLKPDGFGVILRTVAQGKDAKAIDTDMRLLLEKWQRIERRLKGRPAGPIQVHEDVSMASSIVRDLFSSDFDRILIDHSRVQRNVRSYVQAVAPQMASVVQLHKGDKHIFEACNLDRDIGQAFDSSVNLPSGGYIIIERTEAMHVVDVNSGRSGRGLGQEESALKVNLEAAHVLARQVRLRDLGGIIVVDFIDLQHDGDRKKVLDELIRQFRGDRAATRVLPMSDFGLIQITRQRLRPSITATFEKGDGLSRNGGTDRSRDAAITDLILDIESSITSRASPNGRKSGIRVVVHPFTAAYLQRGLPSLVTKWRMKYRSKFVLETDSGLDPMAFRCERAKPDSMETVPEGSAGKQTKREPAAAADQEQDPHTSSDSRKARRTGARKGRPSGRRRSGSNRERQSSGKRRPQKADTGHQVAGNGRKLG